MTPSTHSRARRFAVALFTTGLLAAPPLLGAGSASAREQREPAKDVTDVELIADQFGWDVEATAAHMAAQADFGYLINEVALEFPREFAGAEFAEKPGASSTVFVKGDTPRRLADVVRRADQRVEIVDGLKYSELDQQERSAKIVETLVGQGHEDVATAILPHGEIQVSVAKGASAKLPKSLRDGVRVATAPGRVSVDEVDVKGGVQVYGNGSQCTSGFSVRQLSTGITGISTAAHCTGMNRYSAPGPDIVMTFRGQHNGFFGDVEWHTTPEPEIDNYMATPTQERDVSMVWPSNGYAKNMITCVFSRMQGTRSCDEIYSTSVSSNGASNLIATDNDSTVGGDSGGPWSFNTIADGIHKGDKWIWFGTRNVFSRAALLPAALGVEVMT